MAVTYNIVVIYKDTTTTTATKTISVIGADLANGKVLVRDQMESIRRRGIISDSTDVLTYILPENIVSIVATHT